MHAIRAITAQLCVFQNNYASAFKIMFEREKPVVFSRGKLGIGTDNPQVELDVIGQVDIDGKLFVKDTVEIRGKVTQLQGADVWGDVVFHSAQESFTHLEMSLNNCEGLEILAFAWLLWPLSSEGYLSCHTHTQGLHFKGAIPCNPHLKCQSKGKVATRVTT